MFGIIGNFGPWELALILVIVLIIVGPGKLPKVGESVGKALKGFRNVQKEDADELEDQVQGEKSYPSPALFLLTFIVAPLAAYFRIYRKESGDYINQAVWKVNQIN